MTIYSIKPRFQALLRPLLKTFYHAGITANHITLSALFLSVATGTVLFIFPEPAGFLILPFVLFIRMALNAIDGLLAREFNQQSRLGALLNEVGDVVSDVFLYLPFALLIGSSPALVVAVVMLAILTEFLGVLGQTLNGQRDYSGPMGKSDRAAVFGLWAVIIFFWPQMLAYSNVVWILMLLLLLWTSFNRARAALREAV
ncbi:hypothetical protein CIG19_13870 [Enterobacterales bacterium CwR94]|nr:hypothetical protein CIG19_13870 [Enterobacterales bacterium CwR94]